MTSLAERIANIKRQREAERVVKETAEEKRRLEVKAEQEKALLHTQEACQKLLDECGAPELLEELNTTVLKGKGEVKIDSGTEDCVHSHRDEPEVNTTYSYSHHASHYSRAQLFWSTEHGKRNVISVFSAAHDSPNPKVKLRVVTDTDTRPTPHNDHYRGEYTPDEIKTNDLQTFPTKRAAILTERVSETIAKIFISLEGL